MTDKDSDIILYEKKETTEDAAVSKKQMRAEKAEQQRYPSRTTAQHEERIGWRLPDGRLCARSSRTDSPRGGIHTRLYRIPLSISARHGNHTKTGDSAQGC